MASERARRRSVADRLAGWNDWQWPRSVLPSPLPCSRSRLDFGMLDKYQEMPEWSSQLKQEYVAGSHYVVVKSFSCPRMHLKHRSLRRDTAYGPVQHDVLTQSANTRTCGGRSRYLSRRVMRRWPGGNTPSSQFRNVSAERKDTTVGRGRGVERDMHNNPHAFLRLRSALLIVMHG